jgi:hypothetical protein
MSLQMGIRYKFSNYLQGDKTEMERDAYFNISGRFA